MRHALGVLQRIFDAESAALGKAEQHKAWLIDRGRHSLHVRMPCFDRQVGHMPVRKAAAARIIPHETVRAESA